MAFSWSHGGWRRETDLSARRDKLILHIEEIETLIGGYSQNRALDQEARRDLVTLNELLKRREEDLAELEASLGITLAAGNEDPFVEARPM